MQNGGACGLVTISKQGWKDVRTELRLFGELCKGFLALLPPIAKGFRQENFSAVEVWQIFDRGLECHAFVAASRGSKFASCAVNSG